MVPLNDRSGNGLLRSGIGALQIQITTSRPGTVPYSRTMFRRIRKVFVVALAVTAILVVTVAGPGVAPASAQEVIHVTEDDADSAPVIEPTVSLVATADVNPYFYPVQFNLGPDMSSDSRWIVYQRATAAGPRLFRLDLMTGKMVRVSGDREGFAPHVSDDGSRIVFETGSENEGSAAWMWTASTGEIERLSPVGNHASFVTISDDGSTVAWVQRPHMLSGTNTVVLKGDDRRLYEHFGGAPQVSADGRYLFHTVEQAQLVRRDLTSGEVVPVPPYAPNPFGAEADRSTTDDGTLIATSGPYLNDYHLGSAVTVSNVGGRRPLTGTSSVDDLVVRSAPGTPFR